MQITMSDADLFRERHIENKIYNSMYAETVWNWVKGGMPVASIVPTLKAYSKKETGKEFTVSEPTVRTFKKIMQDLEAKQLGNELRVGDASRSVQQNDLLVCELAIAAGLKKLKNQEMELTLPVLLQFMQFKKSVIGDKYHGQSLSEILDVSKQFYELLDTVATCCDNENYKRIFDDLKRKGWSEDETSDELRTQREVAAASLEHALYGSY